MAGFGVAVEASVGGVGKIDADLDGRELRDGGFIKWR